MIINYLQEIVQKEKALGVNDLYIRSRLKEYLQTILLQFIYSNKKYKNTLIFTGGTCLRHLYGLERLSEDLDFDTKDLLDIEGFALDCKEYFVSTMQYDKFDISIKQQGRQLLLKFPVLGILGLTSGRESELLYIKSDISTIIGKSYKTEKTSRSAFGFNFVALHYNLSSLFGGKIVAVLTRNLFKGQDNIHTIKGRDFYDLLWFLNKGIKVNMQLVREKLNSPNLEVGILQKKIMDKVNLACTDYKSDFKNDLIPFISNSDFIIDYVDNYADQISRYKLIAAD